MTQSRRRSVRRSGVEVPYLGEQSVIRPGGVSWQASVLNFLTRHALKQPVERKGLNPHMARTVVRQMEMLVAGFSRMTGT